MRRSTALTAALAGAALAPATAHAEIVKAPAGEQSRLTVNAATLKTLKRGKVTLVRSGAAHKSGASFSLPYTLSRWDFGTREGDVAHFAKNTGFKLKRGKRSVAVVHPRLVMDSPTRGYVTALIANERIKAFTVSAPSAKATDSATLQTIDGLRLKLTQAGANYLNRGLKRKTLKRFSQFGTLDLRLLKPPAPAGTAPGRGGGSDVPGRGNAPGGTLSVSPSLLGMLPAGTISPLVPGFSQDLDGDGNPDLGVAALPLQDVSFDADTRKGTIKLGGGLVLTLPAGGQVALVDPEVVVGATAGESGLFAKIDGVRVKIGDLDTSTLKFDVADGTVTVDDLHVTVGGALTPLLAPLTGALPAGTPLLSLDLSFPQL